MLLRHVVFRTSSNDPRSHVLDVALTLQFSRKYTADIKTEVSDLRSSVERSANDAKAAAAQANHAVSASKTGVQATRTSDTAFFRF
jgi:hypothetical protein